MCINLLRLAVIDIGMYVSYTSIVYVYTTIVGALDVDASIFTKSKCRFRK